MASIRTVMLSLTVGLCLGSSLVLAAPLDPQLQAVSVSRQFTVVASEGAVPNLASQPVSKKLGLIQLTPAFVAINAERVKDALLGHLKKPDQWRGRILIAIQPPSRGSLSVRIEPTLYANGWSYRMEFPPEVAPERFVEGVTQTLLLELANRSSTGRCAELPLWLSEGMTQMILRSGMNLLAERTGGNVPQVQMVVAPDPLAIPRRLFAERPALTFDELSWPSGGQLQGEARETFRDSSHLLVHSLLARPGGPGVMVEFIGRLSENLNWQTSFLKAFHRSFGLLIDVEKWWAVTVASFSGRDQWQMWSPDEAIARLDQALRIAIEQPQGRDRLPQRDIISLQQLIVGWDFSQQIPVLTSVIRQLGALRMNCPPDLAQLVEDYRSLLETYASRRDASGVALALSWLGANAKISSRNVQERLDQLDSRREMWRREYAIARATPPR